MNTTKIALAAIGLLLVTGLANSAEARDRADRRQGRQNHRVHDGIRSDEITKGEAARLRESKRAIRRTEKRVESDGVVTDKEKARLEKKQDARSRQIYRLKHNDKKDSQTPAPIPPPAPETAVAPVETVPETK